MSSVSRRKKARGARKGWWIRAGKLRVRPDQPRRRATSGATVIRMSAYCSEAWSETDGTEAIKADWIIDDRVSLQGLEFVE